MYRALAASAIVLSFLTQFPAMGFAVDPTADVALAQKKTALRLYSEDPKVRTALDTLRNSGYQLLSTDAIPYSFAYSDEGPTCRFLVTAWLAKPETHGWKAAFITAKVNTDSFGPPSVTIIASRDIQKFLK